MANGNANANANANANEVSQRNNRAAKHLVILGLILQSLHFLFGITAIIGMLINHTLFKVSDGTVYRSHIQWQLITFWVCAALYAIAFFAWLKLGILWPAAVVFIISVYRIAVCAYYCAKAQELNRLM